MVTFNGLYFLILTCGISNFFGNVYVDCVDGIYSRLSWFHSSNFRIKRETFVNSSLQPPEIVEDLPHSLRLIDDLLRLSCKANGNPPPTFKWYVGHFQKNNFTEIIDGDKYTVQDRHLDITKFQSTPGVYFCKATNVLGSVLSRKTLVEKVYNTKDVKIIYTSKEVSANEKAVIVCQIDPMVFFDELILKYWEVKFKNSKKEPIKISKTEGRYSVITLTKPPQLHIRNVTRYDFLELQARCIFGYRNMLDETIQIDQWGSVNEFHFTYHGNPLVSYNVCSGKDIRVTKGSTVELPWCSHPFTEYIIWYKSESQSTKIREKINFHGTKFSLVSERFQNLLIRNIDITEEGSYFAINPSKPLIDISPFNIRVIVQIDIRIEPIRVVAKFGETVKFLCSVTAYPIPKIKWLHNSNELGPTQVHEINRTLRNTTLEFIATLQTAGVYQCVVELRDSTDNRLLDNRQQSASVVIGSIIPKVLSQTPPVDPTEKYSITSISTDTSVVNIKCVFNSYPEATIVWYLDDEPIPIVEALIPSKNQIDLFTVEHSLQINMKKSPSIAEKWTFGGEYRAEATNKYGKAQCLTLVFVAGVFRIRSPKPIVYLHGQTLRLKCYMISESRPDIIWSRQKNGKKIRLPDSHSQSVSSDNREFIIHKLDKEVHEGIYNCESNLNQQKISQNFNITINKPPLLLGDLPKQIFLSKASESITYTCVPLQKPDSPWYAWWEFHPNNYNPVIIHPKGNLDLITNVDGITAQYFQQQKLLDDHYGGSLPHGVPYFLRSFYDQPVQIWMKVKNEFHLSNITCVVKNHAGVIRKAMKITIVNFDFEHAPPDRLTVKLGDRISLNCSAKPNELKAIITWNYEKEKFSENVVNVTTSVISRIHQLPNGTLVVNYTKLDDPERFTCIIKSSIDSYKISKVVKIYIKVPAKIREMNSIIDLKLLSQQYVTCIVHGDRENLYVKWYKWSKEDNGRWNKHDKIRNDSNEKEKESRISLFFDGVKESDEGKYKCEARNEYNEKSVEQIVTLKVVGVPGPVNISTNSISQKHNSISFSWSIPEYDGKKPITGYLVTYCLGDECFNQTTTITSITIDMLRPHQLYNIYVRAINDVGLAILYKKITIRTKQAVPSGTVLNLSALPLSSTSLKLQWNASDPLLLNGELKHYQICFLRIREMKKDNKTNLSQLPWPSGNETVLKSLSLDKQKLLGNCLDQIATEVVIVDLLKFTEYVFRVIVINEVGPGPPLYVRQRTLADNPERPPIQIICTSEGKRLVVEWNPPPHNFINGVLVGYKIVYFPTNQQGEPDSVEDSANDTKHELNKLSPNTNYSIRVRVVNTIGQGPLSDSVYCTTNEAAPSAPNEIKAYFLNNSCAIVAWTPPAQPNGVIQNYYIKLSNNPFPKKIDSESEKTHFSYIICDIINFEEYNVSVYANTKNEGAKNTTVITYFDPRFPRIISFSRVIVADNLSDIILECETIPKNATRNWRYLSFPGYSRTIQNNHMVSQYAFKLTKSTEGIYECYIPGKVESIEYRVSLKPFNKEVPRKPTVDFHEATTNNISLSWISAGTSMKDDPIKTFVVKLTSLNENNTIEYEIPGSLRSFVVPNLDCGSSFKLEFYARNNAGNSTHDIIFVRTRGTKPVIPNTAGIFISKHPKSMCFNLAAFLPGQGCHANSFKITIQPTNQGPKYPSHGVIVKRVSRNDLGKQSCFNVTDLHPDTGYQYEIEAFNKNGSVKANGHFTTLRLITVGPPSVHTEHYQSNNFSSYIWILIPVAIILVFVFCVIIVLSVTRKNTENNMQSLSHINNQLSSNKQQPIRIQGTPVPSIHRNRKLPTPPDNNNVYDKGISEKPEDDEDDEMLKPYATYESVIKQVPMSSRNTQGRQLASYNMGSQAHSYQYPDMIDNQQMILGDTSNLKLMAYENDPKQPLLNQSLKSSNRQYDKGYSIGESRPNSTLRPQNVRSDPHQNIDVTNRKARVLPIVSESEAYRPGSSMCSSTTESSTKEELSQVFRNTTFGSKFTTHLVEQDEDRDSTARGNRSTLLNRSRHINNTLSDDSILPESYCESGSSGDDIGIRNFTQDPPGQILIAPTGFRQFHPSHTVSAAYDSVDRPPALSNFPFQHPSGILPEEDEEKDDNNYTNNFVVV